MGRPRVDTWSKLWSLGGKVKYLFEVEPCVPLTGWVQDGVYAVCWYVPWLGDPYSDTGVSQVKENTTALTAAATLAACAAAPLSYWLDEATHRLYVHTTGGDSPAGYTYPAFFWQCFATHRRCVFQPDWARYPIIYKSNLDKVPACTVTDDDMVQSGTARSLGTVVFNNGASRDYAGFGPMDYSAAHYIYRGKKFRCIIGGAELPYLEYRVYFTGEVDDVGLPGKETFEMRLRDVTTALERKIPTATYLDADYPYLDDNAVGKSKPILLGYCRNVRPTLIDYTATDYIYSIACHPILDIVAARDKGIDVTHSDPGPGLVSFDTSEATVNVCPHPAATLTLDVQGKPDSNGLLLDTYGAMALELMRVFATVPQADIDEASFLAVEAASPYALGIYIDTATPARECLRLLNDSVLARILKGRDGRLYAKKRTLPAATPKIIFNCNDYTGLSVKLNFAKLYYKVRVGYEKNWCVQSETSADPLAAAARQDWSQAYKYVELTSEATKTLYSCEDTWPIDTLITTAADALLFAAEALALVAHPILEVEFKSTMRPYELEIGDTIMLVSERRWPAGKLLVVTSLQDNPETKNVSVSAEAPQAQGVMA